MMRKLNYLILFILIAVFSLVASPSTTDVSSVVIAEPIPTIMATDEAPSRTDAIEETIPPAEAPIFSNSTPDFPATPTVESTPDIFSTFYGCEMEISITSGPLEGENTFFTVLGEDYFLDKGDKFGFGKGTGIYYEVQRSFILHASYALAGNRPLEAEFFRHYLERWADSGPAYIQEKIDALIESDVTWICDGNTILTTRINGVVRLSHQASDRLWLMPEKLEEILESKVGLLSEWVGEIPETDNPNLYVTFCGWGPKSLGDERYTHYRYVISFELIDQ